MISNLLEQGMIYMSFKPALYNFCPQCGKTLIQTEFSGQLRPHCPACFFTHWGEFSLGVGGVVWHEGKVLLVQRAHNPGKGFWTIPGGYVDQDEGISHAAAREIVEETGIIAAPLSVIALRDRPGAKHDAYIVFLLEYQGGTLQADPDEVSDLGFFTLEECEKLNIAELSLSVIKASLTHPDKGFVPKAGIKMVGEHSVLYQIPDE
jgi:ADP-ribose pyrophosphatase YjhB (NUDIX family)